MSTVVAPSAIGSLAGGPDQFAIVAIAALIVVLFLREIASAGAARGRQDTRARFIAQTLNGPILALLSAFLVVLVVKVWGAL